MTNNSELTTDDTAIHRSSLMMVGLGDVQLEIHETFQALENEWMALQADSASSIYQHFDWVRLWTENVGARARIQPKLVVGSLNGEDLFILPLGIARRGPFSVATWLGDSHTNFHMGLYAQHFLNSVRPGDFKDLISHIVKQLGNVDVLELCCQPVVWQGQTNPFTFLPWQDSHNHAYALKLETDFNAVLDRKNGARKRKKYRRQIKHTNELGGAKLVQAGDWDAVDHLLNTALEQMAVRFNKAGIWNRFNDPGVSEFLRQLAKCSLGQLEPALTLYGLEIDGKIRAVFAGGIRANQFSGCFISHADDDLTHLSPGDMLIYLIVEDCARNGLELFDLGRGEERYKTSWCDSTIPMFETLMAYSAKGYAYSSYESAKLVGKKIIRNNETLWNFAKKVRSRLYGRL